MTINVDPDWWKSLFDEVYLATDARSVCNESLTCREIDVFSRLLPMEKHHRILDLCGGHGRHSLELCRRGFRRCTVLDYSRPLLKKGFERAGRFGYPIEFVQSDARDTTLASESFHHVLIMGNSLGYGGSDASDRRILAEARRVLKTGGWLLLDVADGNTVQTRFRANAWHEIGEDVVVCRQRELQGPVVCARELVLSKKKGLIRDRTYRVRIYASQELQTLLENTGFTAVAIHTDFSPFKTEEDVGFMNHRLIAVARKKFQV
jgi:D-alanine-D-alanine ligase